MTLQVRSAISSVGSCAQNRKCNPTLAVKPFSCVDAADSVAFKFGRPVLRVALRCDAVLWAGVPEAAVNEYSYFLFTENEIGSPWDCRFRTSMNSVTESSGTAQSSVDSNGFSQSRRIRRW